MLRSTRLRLSMAVLTMVVGAGCSSAITGSAQAGPGAATVVTSTGPTTTGSSTTRTSTSGPTSSSSSRSTTSSRPADPAGIDGAEGIGDSYYPTAGNGGYQIESYRIALTYDPATNDLTSSVDITGAVTAEPGLRRFNLDLQPSMEVSKVVVNDEPAEFTHRSAELEITPAATMARGVFRARIEYAGKPTQISGGTAGLGNGGWYRTRSGGAVAIGEPFSASAWFPVNEHPADPASFSVAATVPKEWDVISNGVERTGFVDQAPAGMKTVHWEQRQPVASYLYTLYIDKFTVVRSKTSDGKPIVSAFAPGPSATKDKALDRNTPKVIDVLTKHFGPYPFDAAGGIYTGESVGFALETVTRPVYADWVDLDTVVHEIAHQWYGDRVMIRRWADICLNECFASYAPWLWHQDVEKADLDRKWVADMATVAGQPDFWRSPLVDMGAGNEFSAVYSRGPLAVHALRKEIGEKAFATVLSGWIKLYAGKNASFDDWVSYVNKVSGKDNTAFIDAWFRGTVVPPETYLHPGGLGR